MLTAEVSTTWMFLRLVSHQQLAISESEGRYRSLFARTAGLIGLIDDAAAGRLGAANDSTDKESARQ